MQISSAYLEFRVSGFVSVNENGGVQICILGATLAHGDEPSSQLKHCLKLSCSLSRGEEPSFEGGSKTLPPVLPLARRGTLCRDFRFFQVFVPPLCIGRNTLGNIRNMIDVSIAANKVTSPKATDELNFDPEKFDFTDWWGVPQNDAGIESIEGLDTPRRPGQAGNTTLRRNALFRSLLSSVGDRTKFLVELYRKQASGSDAPSGPVAKAFYSTGQPGTRNPTTVAALQQAIQELVGTGRGRAPAKRLRPS